MKSKGGGDDTTRQPHEDLIAWQRAVELVMAVYETAKRFPAEERFALTDQIRRAVVSIPSNITEGNGRDSARSNLHFCLIAHGSLREVETHLVIAHRLGYIGIGDFEQLRRLCTDTGRTLRGLIGYLRKQSDHKAVREEGDALYDPSG